MNTKEIIGAWDAVELNEEALNKVVGGAAVNLQELDQGAVAASSGWVCTVSGECNASGRSCWDIIKDMF